MLLGLLRKQKPEGSILLSPTRERGWGSGGVPLSSSPPQSDTLFERELAAVDLGEFIRGDCTVGAERIDVDVGAA